MQSYGKDHQKLDPVECPIKNVFSSFLEDQEELLIADKIFEKLVFYLKELYVELYVEQRLAVFYKIMSNLFLKYNVGISKYIA